MHYVISDIHGCLDQFHELLEKIDFKEDDRLYVLGDMVDRGEAPLEVLHEVVSMKNAIPLWGNHDLLAYLNLRDIVFEEENGVERALVPEEEGFMLWFNDGGSATAKEFAELTEESRTMIMDDFKALRVYEMIELNGKSFILTHADLGNFSPDKEISDYSLEELLFSRPDIGKRYFDDPDTFIVNGHTPTPLLNAEHEAKVLEENGHILIDCGCVYGGRLAAYRLDDGQKFYVEGPDRT